MQSVMILDEERMNILLLLVRQHATDHPLEGQ